jgi:hypothetical protein
VWTETGLIGGAPQLIDFVVDMYGITCDLDDDTLKRVAKENLKAISVGK